MKRRLFVTGLTMGLMLAPFASALSADSAAPINDDATYHLGAGDKLHITVYNEPSLTADYGISAAGNISFPLIGNVPAKGITIESLQVDLHNRLAEGQYVKDAHVTVEVLNYRPYYILGEVTKPGEYPFSVGLRLEQAVAAAGGYTYRANRGTIYLRRSEDAKERAVKLRSQPLHVMPGDTIRVGERYL
jgi:polysaccharide export outer membrane protein